MPLVVVRAGRSRARPRPRRRSRASSTTSRTRRAERVGRGRGRGTPPRTCPRTRAKFPKPRIGGTSTPSSAASSRNVLGRIAPSRWMWRWAFGSVAEVAHRADHGTPAAIRPPSTPRPKRCVHRSTYSAETPRPSMVRPNKSLQRAPGRCGDRNGEASVADEFDLRELSLDRRSFLRRGAAGGVGRCVARDGRHVGVPRRVR